MLCTIKCIYIYIYIYIVITVDRAVYWLCMLLPPLVAVVSWWCSYPILQFPNPRILCSQNCPQRHLLEPLVCLGSFVLSSFQVTWNASPPSSSTLHTTAMAHSWHNSAPEKDSQPAALRMRSWAMRYSDYSRQFKDIRHVRWRRWKVCFSIPEILPENSIYMGHSHSDKRGRRDCSKISIPAAPTRLAKRVAEGLT